MNEVREGFKCVRSIEGKMVSIAINHARLPGVSVNYSPHEWVHPHYLCGSLAVFKKTITFDELFQFLSRFGAGRFQVWSCKYIPPETPLMFYPRRQIRASDLLSPASNDNQLLISQGLDDPRTPKKTDLASSVQLRDLQFELFYPPH